MAAELPTFPRLVFTILEPLSLVGGFIGAIQDPAWFIAEQLPQARPIPASANHIVVAQQLGNMYLLMCFTGLAVLMTTSELKVVKAYLVALLLGDVGHVAFTCLSMGSDRLMRPHEWNAMAWGNVGFTAFLMVLRAATLLGWFGSGSKASSTSAKKRN